MPASAFFALAFAVTTIVTWCSSAASAARVKVNDEVELGVESSGQVGAGRLLRDRYELGNFIERRALGGQVQDATPGKSFPAISRRSLSDAEHLGQGSFGDTWSALDKKTGKRVAVKLFYKGGRYLSWRTASQDARREFENGQNECTLNKQILGNAARDPVGASRICACYQEHISDARDSDVPVFLVQEMCGLTLEKAFINVHKAGARKRGTSDPKRARALTRQLLEGINFMQSFDPPLIHHDLKPENVAINDDGEVKIIDWGAMIVGNSQSRFSPATATPAYMPPETFSGFGSFMFPAHSYDVFGEGLMYLELLCPSMNVEERALSRPLVPYKVTRLVQRWCGPEVSSVIQEDLNLVNSMVNALPHTRPAPSRALLAHVLQPSPIPASPPAAGAGNRVASPPPAGAEVRVASPPAAGAGDRVASPPPAGAGVRVASPSPAGAGVRVASPPIDMELLPKVARVDELDEDPLFGQHVMDPNEVREQHKKEGLDADAVNLIPQFPNRSELTILPLRADSEVSKMATFVRMQSYISASAIESAVEDWTWNFNECWGGCYDGTALACQVKQEKGAPFTTFHVDVSKEVKKKCYVYAKATCKVTQKAPKEKQWTTTVVSYRKEFTVPKEF